ncbi:phage tail protein, partial [Glaciimonas sp. GG7]
LGNNGDPARVEFSISLKCTDDSVLHSLQNLGNIGNLRDMLNLEGLANNLNAVNGVVGSVIDGIGKL